MKKFLAGLGILSLVLALVTPALAATDTVTATVTPQIIAVSVDVSNFDYGVLNISETSSPSSVITATNDGNVVEKFEIKVDYSDISDLECRTLSGWIDAFFREYGIYFDIEYIDKERVCFDVIKGNSLIEHVLGDYQQAHIAAWLKAAEILEGEI